MFTVYASAHKTSQSFSKTLAAHVMAQSAVKRLMGISTETVMGRFDGAVEMSLRFSVETRGEVNEAVNLFCGMLEQDCVLVVDDYQNAYLIAGDYQWNKAGVMTAHRAVDFPDDFDGDFSYDGEYIYIAG